MDRGVISGYNYGCLSLQLIQMDCRDIRKQHWYEIGRILCWVEYDPYGLACEPTYFSAHWGSEVKCSTLFYPRIFSDFSSVIRWRNSAVGRLKKSVSFSGGASARFDTRNGEREIIRLLIYHPRHPCFWKPGRGTVQLIAFGQELRTGFSFLNHVIGTPCRCRNRASRLEWKREN